LIISHLRFYFDQASGECNARIAVAGGDSALREKQRAGKMPALQGNDRVGLCKARRWVPSITGAQAEAYATENQISPPRLANHYGVRNKGRYGHIQSTRSING
jgi:hypothetical protein